MHDQRKNCDTDTINQQAYPIETDVWPKLKFRNEKNIKFLKENWYIDFTFLEEDAVVHINITLLGLLVQLPISFTVLLWPFFFSNFKLLGFRWKRTLVKQT